MATKPTENVNFFYTPGSVTDPVVQKEMKEKLKAPLHSPQKKSKVAWIIAGFILVSVVAYSVPQMFSNSIPEDTNVTQIVSQPDVFSTPAELERVRGGDTGPYLNNRIDTNLDTAKTQAQLAQDNATNKLKELAGVVDTYAPQLINGK